MPVILLLAAIAILAGVVVVAIGRGGELAIFRSDVPPLRLEFATAADMARFRPPPAFFGYSAQVTDDALQRIARVVADREAELTSLRRQLAALRASSPPAGLVSAGPGPAGPGSDSPAPASYPEPGGWPESVGWAESEPEPESGGWPESEAGTGPAGWAESGTEAGTGPSGWTEAGTGPSGWTEAESGTGPEVGTWPGGYDEPAPEGGSDPGDWTGSGAWPGADTVAEPGAGTLTHGEDLDPGPEPGFRGPGR